MPNKKPCPCKHFKLPPNMRYHAKTSIKKAGQEEEKSYTRNNSGSIKMRSVWTEVEVAVKDKKAVT